MPAQNQFEITNTNTKTYTNTHFKCAVLNVGRGGENHSALEELTRNIETALKWLAETFICFHGRIVVSHWRRTLDQAQGIPRPHTAVRQEEEYEGKGGKHYGNLCDLDKHNLQFGQIHLEIWKNTFRNFDKYILQFREIHLEI